MNLLKRLFWDDYLGTFNGLGMALIVVATFGGIFAAGVAGYYFTGYQADFANCRAVGGHYVGGPLGDCVYPHGDKVRVHLNDR